MPLANYGLVTGTLIDYGPQSIGNPHYILVVQSKRSRYRIAINIESAESSGSVLPELEYRIINDLNTEGRKAKGFAARIKKRAAAGHALTLKAHDPRLPTLDYVRDGVITMKKFRTLALGIHPEKNAFHKTLVAAVTRSMKDKESFIAALGTGYSSRYAQGRTTPASLRFASFGFTGLENIHMNQGNYYHVGTHMDGTYFENGPNQDGAVLFFFSDGKVQGFFSKFNSQDPETDPFGNPLHTGVDKLDATPARVRVRIAPAHPFLNLQRRTLNAAVAASGTALPAGGSPVSASGFVFADTTPSNDPIRPFNPVKDDSDVRNSPFVTQFAKNGVPEPVPGPRDQKYPVIALEDILGKQTVQAIARSGQIVFDSVGDTGAPKVEKLPHEVSVAELMVRDFNEDKQAVPAFLFHLGDVVYYYGEEDYYYDQFYEPYKQYPGPILAIPGNHDGITYSEQMVSLDAFLKAFCDSQPQSWKGSGGIARTTMTQPGVYFTLDAPLVSIIGLYSNCAETYGYLDQQQKLFLYNELVRLKKKRQAGDISAVVIAVHHPPLSFSPLKPSSIRMRDDMDTACRTASFWPDAVLSGHAHVYQRMTRIVTDGANERQIPYVICGAGGYDANARQEINKQDFQLQDVSDPEFRLHRFLATYGYLRLTVQAAAGQKGATLRLEFRSPDTNVGSASDACVLDLETHQLL